MSISTLRRQVKNVALNYTDAQVKVREATSNDPWGPTTALMSEIADMTHNPMQFTEIMSMIWKRLNDHGKNWRHVYKSLVLLDYLIKCGSDRVAAQCKENIFSIETLKDFQHIEDNRDQGLNVRTKAKQMVALLADEEKLKNERARFMLTRKRFMQNGSSGISSDGRRAAGGGSRHRAIDAGPVDPEFEEARPSSLGEEEMQLQIALALSKEECEKEQELRRGDDIRLQIALEESKKEAMARSSSLGSPGGLDASQKPSTSKSQGALDDLLSLGLDEIFNNQQQQQNSAAAAAAGPSTSAQALMMPQNDPWSPRPSTTIPMVGGAAGGDAPAMNSFSADPPLYPTLSAAQNDPWASPDSVIPPPHPSMAAKGTSKELEDILGMSSANNVSSGPTGVPSAQNDPWAAFDNPAAQTNSGGNASLSGMAGGANQHSESANIGQQRGNVKTPESSFLGENSALVNLDNLLGPSINKEQPKKAATNPFLIGSAASAASASKNNPFLANERPSPSLNEMMQQAKHGNTNGNETGGNATTNAGGGQTTSTAAAAPTHQNSPFGPDGSLI